MTSEAAEEYAFNAIKGADNSDIVVLGKFESMTDEMGEYILDVNGNRIPTENSYNIIAKQEGAQYFELDNWNELSSNYVDNEIWKINEKFLDIQTSSGREIYLSHDPSNEKFKQGFYLKELNYLMENGYHFIKEGDLWHAVR